MFSKFQNEVIEYIVKNHRRVTELHVLDVITSSPAVWGKIHRQDIVQAVLERRHYKCEGAISWNPGTHTYVMDIVDVNISAKMITLHVSVNGSKRSTCFPVLAKVSINVLETLHLTWFIGYSEKDALVKKNLLLTSFGNQLALYKKRMDATHNYYLATMMRAVGWLAPEEKKVEKRKRVDQYLPMIKRKITE